MSDIVEYNFEKTLLNNEEKKLIKKMGKVNKVTCEGSAIDVLYSNGFVTRVAVSYSSVKSQSLADPGEFYTIRSANYDKTYEITELGERYLLYLSNGKKEFWYKSVLIPIGVAAVIALITTVITNLLA